MGQDRDSNRFDGEANHLAFDVTQWGHEWPLSPGRSDVTWFVWCMFMMRYPSRP